MKPDRFLPSGPLARASVAALFLATQPACAASLQARLNALEGSQGSGGNSAPPSAKEKKPKPSDTMVNSLFLLKKAVDSAEEAGEDLDIAVYEEIIKPYWIDYFDRDDVDEGDVDQLQVDFNALALFIKEKISPEAHLDFMATQWSTFIQDIRGESLGY